jgi:hypothetical protein
VLPERNLPVHLFACFGCVILLHCSVHVESPLVLTIERHNRHFYFRVLLSIETADVRPPLRRLLLFWPWANRQTHSHIDAFKLLASGLGCCGRCSLLSAVL